MTRQIGGCSGQREDTSRAWREEEGALGVSVAERTPVWPDRREKGSRTEPQEGAEPGQSRETPPRQMSYEPSLRGQAFLKGGVWLHHECQSGQGQEARPSLPGRRVWGRGHCMCSGQRATLQLWDPEAGAPAPVYRAAGLGAGMKCLDLVWVMASAVRALALVLTGEICRCYHRHGAVTLRTRGRPTPHNRNPNQEKTEGNHTAETS